MGYMREDFEYIRNNLRREIKRLGNKDFTEKS
jgi:hypothetical protein